MKRGPGDFERRDDARGDDEDDLDRLISDLSPLERDEIAPAIGEAHDDVAAGRGVPHAEVVRSLKTCGTSDFMPVPDECLR